MNTQTLNMNAAAIDRFNLVEGVRNAQAALGERALARFEKFARTQGGSIYELASARAIERAFARFEWAEIDRIYTTMFDRFFNRDAGSAKPAESLPRQVRIIVVDKVRRVLGKPVGALARVVGKIAWAAVLAILFVAVSEFTSEAVNYYLHR
jgi:hypothetical protein